MKKNLFIFFLIMILTFSLIALTSCGNTPTPDPDPGNDPDPTPGPGNDPAPSDGGVSIKDGDGYVIVYGTRNFDATFANTLKGALKTLGIIDVTIAKSTDAPVGAKEILVGDTNREESAVFKQTVQAKFATGDSAWFVGVVNGKLTVFFTDDSMNAPVIDVIKGFVKDGKLTVAKDYSGEYIYTAAQKQADKEAAEAAAAEAAAKARTEELTALKAAQAAFKADEFGTPGTITSSYQTPTIFPTANAHPRVLINAERVAELKTTINKGENGAAYDKYIALTEQKTDGKLPANTETKHHNEDYNVLNIIEAYALRYAVEGDELYGYRAVVALRNYLTTVDITDSSEAGGRDASGYLNDSYRAWGYLLYTTAEVYDWCYDLLTDGDKAAIIAAVRTKVGPHMEVKYPPSSQGSVTGHGCESQILRDWLSFSIATYDDAPDIYNFVMGRIQQQYVDVREFYYQSGMNSQGNDYGTYRMNFDLIAQHLVRTACGVDIWNIDLTEACRSFMYNLRPDGTLLRIGDDTHQRSDTYSMSGYARFLFYASSVNKDPIAKGEAKSRLNGFTSFTGSDQTLTAAQFLIFNDLDVECGSVEDLPLYVYNGTPVGQIITRDQWGSDSCMLYMKIGEYFAANHEHKDIGSFQIYFHGMLAIDSGCYDKYGTTVHFGYTMSTLAHNSLLIYDPNENVGSSYVNVGGQDSTSGESSNLDNWLSKSTTKRASVLGHKIIEKDGKPVYAYISGDITNAYVSTKVDEVLRFMVGVYTDDPNVPLIFFVFDKITADDPSFKKTFLLHMMAEPTVTGNVTAIKYKGGALINQTLLPGLDGVEIKIVEGPYTGVAPEDAVTRVNDESKSSERGWGRVEISPKVGNKTDYLLNVMYVTKEGDTLATNYATAVSYENDFVAGASLMNVAAFFTKEADGLSQRFEIEGEGTGTVKYSVAGVTAGKWMVYDETKTMITEVNVDAESGFLTFEAPAGAYRILPEGDDINQATGDGYVEDPFPEL